MLTLAALALVELEGEDDVFVVAAELAHEALCLAQLWAAVEVRGVTVMAKRDTKIKSYQATETKE